MIAKRRYQLILRIALCLALTAALGAGTGRAVAQPGAAAMALDECIERALAQNIQVLIAEEGIRRSEADVRTARANRLPDVNVTAFGYSRSRTGPSVRIQENPTDQLDPATGDRIYQEEVTRIPGVDRNSYSFSASLNQTLYDGGSRGRSSRAARSSLRGSERDLESQRQAITFAVKDRYYSLLQAKEEEVVQSEALALSERRLEEARVQLQVGRGTQADVLRLEVALGNAQAAAVNARQAVTLARASLNHIMGEPISRPLEVAPLPAAELEPGAALPELSDLVGQATEGNPTVERLRYGVQAAEDNLAAARAAWYPRVSGSVSYSRNNEVFDRVYQALDQNYRLNIGLALSYNLFDGGLRSAAIDRSRASVRTARLTLQQQERDLTLSVETGYLEMARLRELLQIAARTVELAKEDLRLAEERYRVGKGRLLEVLDAQVGFTQARQDQVRLRYDLAAARADLERLTAGQL
ncbi:MAG: TolC family protein [Gemmatimonadota bacterium]